MDLSCFGQTLRQTSQSGGNDPTAAGASADASEHGQWVWTRAAGALVQTRSCSETSPELIYQNNGTAVYRAASALYSCGEELGVLEESFRLYIRRSIQCNLCLHAKILVVLHELCLSLMGSKECSYSLFFDSQEETFYQESLEKSIHNMSRNILIKRKFLAFLNGDMDAAAEFLEMGAALPAAANARLSHTTAGTFVDGLIAFFFARKHQGDENRWRSIGEAVIDLIRQWETNSNWNFINKMNLLEAEYFFLENNETQALAKYEESIKAAHEHHFIHEEGLAYEREARFHLHYGRNDKALVCLAQSKKCYKNWGAHGISDYIERTIDEIVQQDKKYRGLS